MTKHEFLFNEFSKIKEDVTTSEVLNNCNLEFQLFNEDSFTTYIQVKIVEKDTGISIFDKYYFTHPNQITSEEIVICQQFVSNIISVILAVAKFNTIKETIL